VGHCGSVLCLQFDSDPEEDLLVSGSSDSDVFVWKFSTGEIIQKITKAHRESVLNVRFDKRVLITSSKDKTIKIFNRRPLRYGDVGYGSSEPFGPAARRIKQHGYEPDLAQELPIKEPWSLIGRLDGHTAAVNAIQILGDTVVSVSGDRHIKLWNWPKQVCTKTIPAHDKGIACVEYDGRRIVSGSSDYEVCIFDAITGLKIAQLRGHAALVRTVQAGFGDLPYSLVEDEIEARAVDNAYYRAVEAGEVPPYHMRTGPRQARRVNAGSSLPIDIQATGSMLPPGGGGGRKYSRIVSGSYDQTIIIWRRDKGGEWKPNHHLRQEEAAAAAQQRVSSPHDDDEPGGPSIPPLTDGQSNQLPSAQSQVGMSTADIAAHSRALIDQVVPLGVAQLAMLLQQHPALLLHHDYMQIAIEREHSPFLRTLLRQAVADALSMAQAIQASQPPNAGHATGDNAHPGPPFVAPVGQGHGMPPHYGMPAQVPAPPQRHHPHLTLAPPEPAPQRIFKLQFDAHQIVCCSQASTIVGWDFCNGDPELEQAVRFFATID
jgi:F-box and WD-40 domain protein 1/11